MAILFDLDGVFYQADNPVLGSADVARWVTDNGIPHLFLTNTSSKPRSALVKKLSAFGIATDESHILTPPVVTMHWLNKNLIDSKIALFVSDITKTEFSEFDIAQQYDEKVAAVIIGDLGSDWDFDKLNHAFQLLMTRPKPVLIALGMTRYWQADDGLRLDVAPFVMALSHASEIEPLVMGKPALMFYKTAIDILAEPINQIVMVGDDIRGDIQGAQQAGIEAVLVRTGKFRDSDLDQGIDPSIVLNSIADFPAWYGEFFL